MMRLIFIFLSVFSATSFAAPGIKLNLTMFPGSGFKAESPAVEGNASIAGNRASASVIRLKLDTLKTGIEMRDHHMINNYLEAQNPAYAYATIMNASGENGRFNAQLELHGVHQPVTGTYRLEGSELVANFDCKIESFKIKKPRYMNVGVGDDVKVEARVPAVAAAAAPPPASIPVKRK